MAEEAQYRCGYCLTAQQFTAKRLHVEHIIPIAAGGGSDIQNLWLACDLCNSYAMVDQGWLASTNLSNA